MYLKLRYQQLKPILLYIDCYIKTSQNLQTKKLDTHTQKKMQPKHNTKDSYKTDRQENKRREERTTKTNPKN